MLPAFGLYTHIRANRIRSWFLLAGLVVLSLVLVFALALFMRGWTDSVPTGYRHTLGGYVTGALRDLRWLWPLALAGSVGWIAIAFRFNQALIDKATGARVVERSDAPRLYHLLENLCISRGVPVPILRLMQNDAPNAFATGLSPDQYSVTVTTGLLAILDDAELECVLAHELTHIRNDDVRTMMIAVVVTGILSFAGEVILRGRDWFRFSSRGSSKDKGSGVAAMIIALVLIGLVWFLSQFVKFALSRSREYLADAGAAELTKNPDAMISALQKIDGKGEIETVPSGIMELCLDNPRSGLQDMFATHPSIASRIDALQRYAGGKVTVPVVAHPGADPIAEPAEEALPLPGAALGNPWHRARAGIAPKS